MWNLYSEIYERKKKKKHTRTYKNNRFIKINYSQFILTTIRGRYFRRLAANLLITKIFHVTIVIITTITTIEKLNKFQINTLHTHIVYLKDRPRIRSVMFDHR